MIGCEAIIDGLKKLMANIRTNYGIVGWIEPYYIIYILMVMLYSGKYDFMLL